MTGIHEEVVNGQDVIDWMVDDLSFDEVAEGIGSDLFS